MIFSIDPLSVIFLSAIGILSVCAAIYGVGYMRPFGFDRAMKFHLLFFLLLVIAMAGVVTAANIFSFLASWELLSLVTYFLIMFHDHDPAVRRAGFLYLIATHCGTFCLFVMFFLLGHYSGSGDFAAMAVVRYPAFLSGVVFLLALAGFGVKAGYLPMHIWLPHAHPAAPAHISALLSGVAIKTGIYGICRILWILKILPHWCAYFLLLIGIVSGLMGVLYALGQHELKKLLAYHSIENIGIITLGLGIGLLGINYDQPFLAVLGFGGGLLHILNHALFKGLLFLCAGSVIHKTGTGDIGRLGGLAKSMPFTAAMFLTGALSICGLPLFNGFISEFIIYFGFFQGFTLLPLRGVAACALGAAALAFMGALALACFTKVYGTVFSSVPRSIAGSHGGREHEISFWMAIPMAVLGALCLYIGIMPGAAVRLAFDAGNYLAHESIYPSDLPVIFSSLTQVVAVTIFFILSVAALAYLRHVLTAGRPRVLAQTWSCGFSRFTPRMQYSAGSFASSVMMAFKRILFFKVIGGEVNGFFPKSGHMSSSVRDFSQDFIFKPFYAGLVAFSRKVDSMRVRFTQAYLLYIFLFLIFLLIWKLR